MKVKLLVGCVILKTKKATTGEVETPMVAPASDKNGGALPSASRVAQFHGLGRRRAWRWSSSSNSRRRGAGGLFGLGTAATIAISVVGSDCHDRNYWNMVPTPAVI